MQVRWQSGANYWGQHWDRQGDSQGPGKERYGYTLLVYSYKVYIYYRDYNSYGDCESGCFR